MDLFLELLLSRLAPTPHTDGTFKDLLVVFAEGDALPGIVWFGVLARV